MESVIHLILVKTWHRCTVMRLTVEPAEKCLLLADNVTDRSSVAGILFNVAGKSAVISCMFILVVWLEKRFLLLFVKGLSVPSAPHVYALCMCLLTVLSAKRFGIY